MCAQPADRHWYISRQGKRYGPYTFTALTEAAAKGVITADTNIWRLGWVGWHPASRVPGLLDQSAVEAISGTSRRPDRGAAPQVGRDAAAARNGATPDGAEHRAKHAPGDPDQEALEEEADDWPLDPPRDARLNQNEDTLEGQRIDAKHDASKPADAVIDPPRPEPPQRENAVVELRAIRDEAPVVAERSAEVPTVPPQLRDGSAIKAPPARPARWRKAAVAVLGLMLLGGSIWGLLASGTIIVVPPQWVYRLADTVRRASPPPALPPESAPATLPGETPPPQTEAQSSPQAATSAVSAETDDSGLPAAAAALPAVIALKRTNPAAFDKFKKRLDNSAANAPDDQILALTRMALRKSVKRQLANAPDETLLEITQAYLDYMQALQFSNPESCVALSDDSKGASLTVNLEKDLPALFAREMTVLERIAGIDPNTLIAPLTAEQARPLLDIVFGALRAQPVRSELLGRSKLTPSEFMPYCSLVIAFYEGVLALPTDQRMSLLRYLYSAAAADPDDDAHPK